MPTVYPRTIWVVRHCEREDNINRNWQKNGGEGLRPDNSQLSQRGRVQAMELANRFKKEEIAHIFASPFDRTIETAHTIVDNHPNRDSLRVKPEPGLCEALYLCDKPFPSFWDAPQLKAKFPLVDDDYDAVFTKHAMPKEGFGDDECIPRLTTTLRRLTSRFDGPLVFVGHGASIGALHEIVSGDFKYVGQATVSKFVEESEGKFKVEYSSDPSHLSDKTNLRPW